MPSGSVAAAPPQPPRIRPMRIAGGLSFQRTPAITAAGIAMPAAA
jgi:hypothetical protein